MTKMFENALKSVQPNGTCGGSKVPYAYDIGSKDMVGLYEMMLEGKYWDAITAAFHFGFVMGNRATHSRKLKRL